MFERATHALNEIPAKQFSASSDKEVLNRLYSRSELITIEQLHESDSELDMEELTAIDFHFQVSV